MSHPSSASSKGLGMQETSGRGRLRRTVAGSVLGAAVVAVSFVPLQPAAAAENGRIAYEDYVEYEDENGLPKFGQDIFTANSDGTDEVNLTDNGAALDIDPAWSPDGTRIAFASNRDGNFDLYTMAADGTDVQQVTFTYGIEYQGGSVDYFTSWEPSWSPDGTQLAYSGYRVNPFTDEIYVTAIGQTEETYTERLVTDPSDFQNAAQPDWSPVGNVLLYTQYFDYYTTDVWRIGVDGTGAANLTAGFARDLNPAWSPDAARIAFISDREHSDPFHLDATDVYVMQADGTGVVRVTEDVTAEEDVEWSPDGTQIIFQQGYYEPVLYTVPAPPTPGVTAAVLAAAVPVRVGTGGSPSWQPIAGTPTCTVIGTRGNDVLKGTAGADILCGLGGNDTLQGGPGADVLVGGNGADRLAGGRGPDEIYGGAGDDLCDAIEDVVVGRSCTVR